MADQPVQVLTPAEQLAASEIKNLVLKVALRAALNSIEAQTPFLMLPVIKPVFEFLATTLVTAVYGKLDQIVVFDIVDIRDEAERTAYDSAKLGLQNALTKGDQNGIDQARADLEKKLADLIRFPASQ